MILANLLSPLSSAQVENVASSLLCQWCGRRYDFLDNPENSWQSRAQLVLPNKD